MELVDIKDVQIHMNVLKYILLDKIGKKLYVKYSKDWRKNPIWHEVIDIKDYNGKLLFHAYSIGIIYYSDVIDIKLK